MGEFNHPYLPGVGNYQLRLAVSYRFHDLNANDGVALRGIGTDDEYAICMPDFIDGVGHGSAAERCDQTGHRGRMSETGAVVDVVRTDYRAGKFLQQVIFFVSAFSR